MKVLRNLLGRLGELTLNALVGYTGFVGSNLYEYGLFDKVYNSKNIEEAYGLKPDLLVYSGMRAEKYLANNFPEKDLELVNQAKKNIEMIGPKKLVLISTIDVLKDTRDKNEEKIIETDGLQPYGYNRYLLECWVRDNYSDSLIVRLPGLFGNNIKKNFIYDYIHRVPFMLKKDKFEELSFRDDYIIDYYEKLDDGFFRLKSIDKNTEQELRERFNSLEFTALNFTDSRNVYQFYPLNRLWKDIQIAISNDIRLLHLATEPVSVAEVYEYLSGEKFCNELDNEPVYYNYTTVYAEYYGSIGKYLIYKDEILEKIYEFVRSKGINDNI